MPAYAGGQGGFQVEGAHRKRRSAAFCQGGGGGNPAGIVVEQGGCVGVERNGDMGFPTTFSTGETPEPVPKTNHHVTMHPAISPVILGLKSRPYFNPLKARSAFQRPLLANAT